MKKRTYLSIIIWFVGGWCLLILFTVVYHIDLDNYEKLHHINFSISPYIIWNMIVLKKLKLKKTSVATLHSRPGLENKCTIFIPICISVYSVQLHIFLFVPWPYLCHNVLWTEVWMKLNNIRLSSVNRFDIIGGSHFSSNIHLSTFLRGNPQRNFW